jgi:hypothetical protein
MNRRDFLGGMGAALMLPALPAVDLDPMVRFISYQSWPLDEPRPDINWHVGTTGSRAADAPRYKLSQVRKPHMAYIREIR